MRKNRNDQAAANDCGHKSDLMDYLYGEAGATEAKGFERHLEACESCREEHAAFGRVRDDLSAWQIGFTPRTEVRLPRRGLAGVWDLAAQTPLWARRAVMAGAAALALLAAFAIAQTGLQTNGRAALLSREEVDQIVRTAVDQERARMREETAAQMAALREQLAADQKAQIEAIGAEQQARLQAMKASLKIEAAKSMRQNRNIRTFFASEDSADLWATGR